MREIMYMENTPFLQLLKITSVLPMQTELIFLSEATAQQSLIPPTLHPPALIYAINYMQCMIFGSHIPL